MQAFCLKTRIFLGEGSLSRLRKIATGYDRVLILASRSVEREGFLEEAKRYIGEAGAEVESIVGVSAEPSYEYVEEILPRAREFEPELIVAVGGGSVIDVAKAVKVFYDSPGTTFEEIAFISRFQRPKPIPKLKTPLVAVPSTSGAGSEVSGASVLKMDGVKYNLVSPEIAPDFAILDPRLPLTMPPKIARNSGLDVLVHAIEAYVSRAASPFSDAMAVGAAKTVFEWLPESVRG
ncbi:iron-containing alcohol dehydrogenase, partial [Thermococcus sp.]